MVTIVCDQGSNKRSFLHQMENVILKKPLHKIWWHKDICALLTLPTCWKIFEIIWRKLILKSTWQNSKLAVDIVDFYDELSVYEFLWNKTYQEAGCLVYLTPAMITFVDRLEKLFCVIFEGIINMPHVVARLCKCSDDFWTFLKCMAVQCSLWLKSMVKLYMKVWIFHALKRSTVQINQEKMGKCNRKMLKLSYL